MNDLEEIYQNVFDQTTSSESVREAVAFPTVVSGAYRLEIQTKEITEGSDQSPWPGRFLIHVKSHLFDKETGEKRKTEFFDISPIEMRTQTGRLDGPYQLWCQVAAALDMRGRTNRDIFEALDTIPYNAYVVESFRVTDDQGTRWKTPRNEDERTEYRKQGEARNFIRSLKALQS